MTTGILTKKLYDVFMDKRSLEQLSDKALMARIADQDESAFSIFCKRFLKWAYRFDFSFLQNKSEAEDAVQEKFLRIWQKANTYRMIPGSKVTNYLMKIDKNICLDMVRRGYRKREIPVSGSHSDGDGNELELLEYLDYCHNNDDRIGKSPENQAETTELMEQIFSFTQNEFTKCQFLVFWGFVSGMSYREIAVTYSLKQGSVRGYIARSFATVRQKFAAARKYHE